MPPKATAADAPLMRQLNRSILLNLIRQEGSISRAGIAKSTRLSRSTVSNIITSLLTEDLVRESGAGESQGGRRPIMVHFNHQAGSVVGVDLAANRIMVLVTDLDACTLAMAEEEFSVAEGPEAGLLRAIELTRKTVARAGVDFARVVGLGVGVPGPLNFGTGTVVAPPIMPGWDGVPLRLRLQETLGIPVYVDNDANLAALGEHWRGAGRGVDDMVYIKLEVGIGCGLVLHGELYRGQIGSAGEIGHLVIDEQGPVCKCGSTGCLEAVAGAHAILSRAEASLQAGRASTLTAAWRNGGLTMRDMVAAARHGDSLSKEIFHQAGRHVGLAVASLVNVLNPALIIIGGSVSQVGDDLLEPISQTVRERALRAASRGVRVVPAQLGREATALGAVTLVLQEAYRSPALSIRTRL